MKKFIIPVAIVAMMGVSGYFGRQALNNTPSGMSELEFANAEALSDDEKPEFQCRWSSVYDSHKCEYEVCIKNGDGNPCVCGATKG